MKFSTKIKFLRKIKSFLDFILPYSVQDYIQRRFLGGTYLSQIEFHIVDHCNLNCAYCDHFTPLAEKNIIELSKIINDFKTLKTIFDRIGEIYIVGGEPLLHPNLSEIFEPLRNLYPESKIAIITNGILLSETNEDFYNNLKKYNIILNMTRYPLKINYEEYENKCRDLGVGVELFSFERDKMQKLDLNIEGKSNPEKAFLKCSRKACHFIRDLKLYGCTIIPNICFLNKFFNLNFQVKESDFIDLTKIKSASKIKSMLSKHVGFCKYCNDKDLTFDTYRVSRKEKSEWIRES